MTLLDVLQWIGAALGLLGAWFVADRRAPRRQLGFALWLVSNSAWIAWAAATGTWGLLAMQAVFLLTSAKGWWVNRPAPPP